MSDIGLLGASHASHGHQHIQQPRYGALLTVPLLAGDGPNGGSNGSLSINDDGSQPPPPASSVDGDDSVEDAKQSGDDRMRRRLKYFFMTPCEKYQAKGRLPLKLLLQLLKVLVVTLQLYVFGMESSSHVYFLTTTQAAFRHLYLESWDASWESPPYPPAHGPYAVYTYDSFYSSLDFALAGYNDTLSGSIGSFAPTVLATNGTKGAPQLCLLHYTNLTVDAANFRYTLDRQVSTRCFEMLPLADGNGTSRYDSRRQLQNLGYKLNFDNVLAAKLQFNVNAIHFNFDQPRLSTAECFLFNITILFDNRAHTGQVLVSLDANPIEKRCGAEHQFGPTEKSISYTFLDVSVILVCIFSFVSCVRSLYKGNRMRMRTRRYFRNQFEYKLSLEEQCEFINLWFVLIIVNDLLTLIGSLMKILIEYKTFDNYTVCSLFLGSGSMLVWFGTLRYLGYFSKYNVLLLTIKRSLPDILRFLICAIALFLAFSLFGWITFGPYHVKFRTFFSSLECLFALVNGDDIFTTFALIPASTNAYIYVVSRIYLYSFIALFIYIVLNVCISIILEAYESVTRRRSAQSASRMWAFIAECADPASSMAYRNDGVSRRRRLSTAASAADLASWLSRWFHASLVSRVNVGPNQPDGVGDVVGDYPNSAPAIRGGSATFVVGDGIVPAGVRRGSHRRRRSRRRLLRRGVGGGDLHLPESFIVSADAVATSSEADDDEENCDDGKSAAIAVLAGVEDSDSGSSDTVDDLLDGGCLERNHLA